MKGSTLLLATGLGLAAALSFRPAAAQSTAQQAQQRYERTTKGADIDDYIRRLKSEEPEERLQAVRSLEEAKDKKAIEYLVQAIGDEDMRVKAKAIDALGNLRASEATPVLIQHLFLRSTDASVKNRILASLGKIGDASSAAPIVEFLHRDLNHATRGTAIFALGEISSPDSLTVLTEIAETDSDVRLQRLAREAASKIRHQQALLQAEANEPEATFLNRDQPPAQ